MSGGISGYASAVTIHNEILATRPDLIAPLYAGYHLHRFGEQPPGEPPITRNRVPVFSMAGGVFNVVYIRGYIDLAADEDSLGEATVDEDGKAAWTLDASLGDALPFDVLSVADLEGYVVEVRDADTATALLDAKVPAMPPFRCNPFSRKALMPSWAS